MDLESRKNLEDLRDEIKKINEELESKTQAMREAHQNPDSKNIMTILGELLEINKRLLEAFNQIIEIFSTKYPTHEFLARARLQAQGTDDHVKALEVLVQGYTDAEDAKKATITGLTHEVVLQIVRNYYIGGKYISR